MSEQAAAEQMQMPKHGEFCWTEIVSNILRLAQRFTASFRLGIKAKHGNGRRNAVSRIQSAGQISDRRDL